MFKHKAALKNVGNVHNTIRTSMRGRDLSEGLSNRDFKLDDLSRYGIAGSIMGMAFDPVQGLMALSTDRNEIHVYGQQKVEHCFKVQSRAPIITLKFIKSTYLVAVDSQNTLFILSLYSNQVLHSYSAPGAISSIESDYSLEYLLIGLSNGTIIVFDVDRCCIAPFKIGYLQRTIVSEERNPTVLSIKWHPRDFGTILITYTRCAVIYSFTTGEVKGVLKYDLPPGAPGGDNIKGNPNTKRSPRFNNSIWHPNGLHIVSVHDDNSIVFWDANDGTLLLARTLYDIDVNVPGNQPSGPGIEMSPIIKIAWLCEENPEKTSLLICGGDSSAQEGLHNFTYFDFGVTPKYSITSYTKMADYYANPVQHKVIPVHTPSLANIVDFLPLGISSPYFAGGHNPQYVMVLMEDGTLKFLNYPAGDITYRSDFFPLSLAWINPKVTCSSATIVPTNQWLGMMSSTKKARSILHGGVPSHKPGLRKQVDLRSALITGHQNGYLRIWDASYGDLSESSVLEVDTSVVLASDLDTDITKISFASEVAELTYAMQNNDVALFKFGKNKHYDPTMSDLSKRLKNLSVNTSSPELIDISDRTPYHLKEGFLPVSLVKVTGNGRVEAIKNSNIGFVSIAYQSGLLVVLDRRGPAIIFKENLMRISGKKVYGTSMEFLITEHNDEGYSSILLLVGTNTGELLFFKILPEASGRYRVAYISSEASNDSAILEIVGLNSETGFQTFAKMSDMQKLSQGEIIPSYIIARSAKDIMVIKCNGSKLSHKHFPGIAAGGMCMFKKVPNDPKFSVVYSALQTNGELKVLTIPALSELNSLRLPFLVDPTFLDQSVVLPSGDIIVRVNGTEAALVNIFGKGLNLQNTPNDVFLNKSIVIPTRPSINTLQFFRGTKLVTYEDFILLMSGPRRPSTRAEESKIAWSLSPYNPENAAKIAVAAKKTLGSGDVQRDLVQSDEFKYDRPVRKAHHNVDLNSPFRRAYKSFTNGIEALEEQGNEYANNIRESVNESVSDTKNTMVTGAIRSKFGL